MITHKTFVNYSGDGQRALDTALQNLLPLGFKVESQGSRHLVVTSQASYNSTKQDALLGISRVEFEIGHSAMTVKAELGGVQRVQRMLFLLLACLEVLYLVIFSAMWYLIDKLRPYPWILAFPLAAFIPWIFAGPKLTGWLKSHTVDALGALLAEMTAF